MRLRSLALLGLGLGLGCSDPEPPEVATTGTDTEPATGSTSPGTTTSAETTDAETSPPTGDGTGDESTSDGSDTGEPELDPREVELRTYAPRIWLTADEQYWPSSVEWAFPEQERFAWEEGRFWLRTLDPLDAPSSTLPFFAGDLATAPVYAYWADKGDGVVDLVYFVYYPYNRGKSAADTIWGNHVGDWEHITVRLLEQPDGSHAPSQVYLSAHGFGGAYRWGSGEIEIHDGTHPVVYAAWGSHGFWSDAGEHVYMSIGETVLGVCVTLVCTDLSDRTQAGVAWDTWQSVYGMDFFAQEGLGDATWPVWMSDDFGALGDGDPNVPGMGPIYRWGNPQDCSVLGIPIDITDLIGVCRLENGPTGPISKDTWGPELL
ncbi:MAG: Vps62-related protein [Myxococcales bacterium]|nr:Vps62-related protein [Myxococcales bacterium]MCB9716094.1 Vps62-related protein [Myxococcales bacterium]